MENKNATTPPAAGEAAHTPTGFRFFKLNDRMLRLVRNSETDARLETHLCEIPIIYKETAAFIVRACNENADLHRILAETRANETRLMENEVYLKGELANVRNSHAALVAALEETVNQLRTVQMKGQLRGVEQGNMVSAAVVQAQKVLEGCK